MPEMKNSFQRGRMNKDLDERIVPKGEYRDAMNVEVSTSDGSDVGTLQNIKGNTLLSNLEDGVNDFRCVGVVRDDKNNTAYWLVSGLRRDMILEFDETNTNINPVCINNWARLGHKALNFSRDKIITGINIIDNTLFWTDDRSEPKRINIERGKAGSTTFTNDTILMVTDTYTSGNPNALVSAKDENNNDILVQEKHLTVIRKSPRLAPVLEMIDTERVDVDQDKEVGGEEISRKLSTISPPTWLDANGDFLSSTNFVIDDDADGETAAVKKGGDFVAGDFLNIYSEADPSINVRVQIVSITAGVNFSVNIFGGNTEIEGVEDLIVELEQPNAMFESKFPRFACRWKYEDGEYSAFSPFTQVAFLPGPFSYLPKQGHNLAMVNNVRKLVIKDFVTRDLPKEVVSIDILYKESNSPNVYSIKTIKRKEANTNVWDAWNGDSQTTVCHDLVADPVGPIQVGVGSGIKGITKGYFPITSEMIHAVLPSNQLLRPWDNVPRKALGQEIVGNRLVYGNYLQNYNLEDSSGTIKPSISAKIRSWDIGSLLPEEVDAGPSKRPLTFNPAKSIKTLRTYQVGVVYIDKYGRETPVFSEDTRGGGGPTGEASVFNKKDNSDKKSNLIVWLKNNPPTWATHFKFFVKETSNEYYNVAMDRWYDAADGNIWLSFPSAERNKLDEDTYLILKKEHNSSNAVHEPARYKIIAIENEAPRFVKTVNSYIGVAADDLAHTIIGDSSGVGYPLFDGSMLSVEDSHFTQTGLHEQLINKGIYDTWFRVRTNYGVSKWYKIKRIQQDVATLFWQIYATTKFGADMNITTTDGTLLNKELCKVEVVRRIEENKPEFEGRFFVKILKDNTIIDLLGANTSVTTGWQTVDAKSVQYIAPYETQANNSWDGYGYSEDSISRDKDEDSHHYTPGPVGVSEGRNYWQMASNCKRGSDRGSDSSGWFIDKVEGFRPARVGTGGGGLGWLPKYVGTSHNPSGWADQGNRACWGIPNGAQGNGPRGGYWYTDFAMSIFPINTYDKSGNQTYLNTTGFNKIKAPGSNALASHGVPLGGGILRSRGIDATENVIHLSFSGLGSHSEEGGAGKDFQKSLSALSNHTLIDDAGAHADDIAFIMKLTQPGTLWRWREDPGKVVYRTTDTSTPPTGYNSASWLRDKGYDTAIDNDKGILIFNYASFGDYFIDPHHGVWYQFGHDDCFGIGVGPWVCNHKNMFDFVSRANGATLINEWGCLGTAACYYYSLWDCSNDGAGYYIPRSGGTGSAAPKVPFYHYRYPMHNSDWRRAENKRRRFAFSAVVHDDGTDGSGNGGPLGSVGPHFYLPTNDPNLPPHHDHTATALSQDPTTNAAWTTVAPGIRADGMYSGYNDPGGAWTWHNGTELKTETVIPWFKRRDANGNSTRIPGSVTWEIVELEVFDNDNSTKYSSTNPAIWETEPKEDVGLDIYHEASQAYPIYLNNETIEQHVGAINKDIRKNSYVWCWDSASPPGSGLMTIQLDAGSGNNNRYDIRVHAAYDRFVQLADVNGVVLGDPTAANPQTVPPVGSYLIFLRADGSSTEALVGSSSYQEIGGEWWFELVGNSLLGHVGVHSMMVKLPWFNCYSFGNGVESDRVRDDYNQVTIDNGPKASTTLEEPYLEERRKNGFIWSGLYNSNSGVNNLNQFIMAEKITKDTNPTYGSIQKLQTRDSDLVAYCEDRVLRVLANKDALYNADGDVNLVSTNRVLGNIKPFVGDYGISKNPESFASDSYRSYFADASRGAVLRLSGDGITPISDIGMKDWFSDNLPGYKGPAQKLIGSFDDRKEEYNLTFAGSALWHDLPMIMQPHFLPGYNKTITYSEPSKGWVSFKSFIQRNGFSLNNNYYTFDGGELYEHHSNELRNTFYQRFTESTVDVLLNDLPSVIKSFTTLNYEGSQSRITQETINNPNYYDNVPKEGWYAMEMISDNQELGQMEFWDKEGKWFSQVKGITTEWLNDGTAGNIDPREFSYQGIGNATVSCSDCPIPVTYNCVTATGAAGPGPTGPGTSGGPAPGSDDAGQGTIVSGTVSSGPVGPVLGPGSATPVTGPGIPTSTGPQALVSQTQQVGLAPGLISFTPAESVAIPSGASGGVQQALAPGAASASVATAGFATAAGQSSPSYGGPLANVTNVSATTPVLAPGAASSSVAAVVAASVTSAGNCVDPGDGTGFFTGANALIDCQASYACQPDTWECNINIYGVANCVNVGPVIGPFATQADCQANCSNQFPVSFDCVQDPTGGSSCIDPGDGTGFYQGTGAYFQCMLDPACAPAPPESWNCETSQSTVGGWTASCVDPGDGSGQYTDANSGGNPGDGLAACNANCVVPSSFDCDGQGNCVGVSDNSGQYPTLAQCLSVCATTVTYDCLATGCSQVPGTGGQYPTMTACENDCGATFVGPCNITNAPTYDANVTYSANDVVEHNGSYMYALYDPPVDSNGVNIFNVTGFPVYDYNLMLANPWVNCSNNSPNLPDNCECSTAANPTPYLGEYDNSTLYTFNGGFACDNPKVFYIDNYYHLNCEKASESLQLGQSIHGTSNTLPDGTVLTQAQVDDIWDGIIDCANNGIIGIPPLGVGSYLGFWERCADDTQLQCGNIASTGCCNPASPFYSYWCTQDPTCTCTYNC
jgi:hypothetical protein